MAEHINPFINFRDGIKGVPAFFGGDTRDLLNVDVDDNGFLALRRSTRSINIVEHPTTLVKFLQDTNITVGLNPEIINGIPIRQSIEYADGDQIYVAHWFDQSENEQVTRLYFFDADVSVVPIREGRILLIASKSGQYFIDVDGNDKYTWILTGPVITDYNVPDAGNTADIIALRIKILRDYQRRVRVSGRDPSELGPNEKTVYLDYPFSTQQRVLTDETDAINESFEIYAYKVLYVNTMFDLRSKVSQTFVDIHQPAEALIDWLRDPNIALDDPTHTGRGPAPKITYPTRYDALRALDIINDADVALIESQPDLVHGLVFNIETAPDWATDIEVYRAEVGIELLELETREVDSDHDIGDAFYTPGVNKVFGLSEVVSRNAEDDKAYFSVAEDIIQGIPDEEYQRVDIDPLPVDRTAPLNMRIPTNPAEQEIYLDAFYTESPPRKLYAITAHAGRIYGADADTQEIVFSHIDGNGVSNYFAFPPQNKLPTTASGVAPVEKIEQMPNRGGLYVFKRDAIHYIDGQNIFSGLYDINVSAQTDISAADYKKNVGCISARSVKTMAVWFCLLAAMPKSIPCPVRRQHR